MSSPDGKPKTVGEVRLQVTREAKVQKNRIAHYYKETDSLWAEVLRKQLHSKEGYPGYEEVEEFKQRCIDDGVPEEFFKVTPENTGTNGLPKHLKIRATRASGSGSQVADQIEMESMMKLLPTFGQRGRTNVIKDYVSAHRGFRYIPRYFPVEDQANEPMNDDTIASIENNQLEKGEMVIVSPDNKHPVHAPRHLERLKQIAKSYQEAEQAARQAGSEKPSVDAIVRLGSWAKSLLPTLHCLVQIEKMSDGTMPAAKLSLRESSNLSMERIVEADVVRLAQPAHNVFKSHRPKKIHAFPKALHPLLVAHHR